MDAVSFLPRFRLPSLSPSIKLKLGKPLFSLKEIADGPTQFTFRKDFTHILSIRADGNRKDGPPQKSTASGGTSKRDESEIPQSSDAKSSKSKNQEEIIALFRRIQSSISKGDSTTPKRRSSNSNNKPSIESVLEVLRQSRKQAKGEPAPKKEGNKEFVRKRDFSQKLQLKEEYSSVNDFKLTRPPSNFVKRSPIPSLSSPRQKVVLQTELKKLKEMKVSELKEIAKTRGIKGYSKLKKSELIELLRSPQKMASPEVMHI